MKSNKIKKEKKNPNTSVLPTRLSRIGESFVYVHYKMKLGTVSYIPAKEKKSITIKVSSNQSLDWVAFSHFQSRICRSINQAIKTS